MVRLLGIAASLFVGREAFTALVRRRRDRRVGYAAAVERARESGAPLLVVGDPDSGFITKHFGRDYGCGDVCTDIVGCSGCPVQIKAPLETALAAMPRASHVIYVSCTLEYVTDLPHVISELERVAIPGGLYVVRVDPTHLSTWYLYPGAKWVLHDAPFGDYGMWNYVPFRR
jgi:hypothetical protein